MASGPLESSVQTEIARCRSAADRAAERSATAEQPSGVSPRAPESPASSELEQGREESQESQQQQCAGAGNGVLGRVEDAFRDLYGREPRLLGQWRARATEAVMRIGVDAAIDCMSQRRTEGSTPSGLAYFVEAFEDLASQMPVEPGAYGQGTASARGRVSLAERWPRRPDLELSRSERKRFRAIWRPLKRTDDDLLFGEGLDICVRAFRESPDGFERIARRAREKGTWPLALLCTMAAHGDHLTDDDSEADK